MKEECWLQAQAEKRTYQNEVIHLFRVLSFKEKDKSQFFAEASRQGPAYCH